MFTEVTIDTLEWSGADGRRELIPLGVLNGAKAMSYLNESIGGAIVPSAAWGRPIPDLRKKRHPTSFASWFEKALDESPGMALKALKHARRDVLTALAGRGPSGAVESLLRRARGLVGRGVKSISPEEEEVLGTKPAREPIQTPPNPAIPIPPKVGQAPKSASAPSKNQPPKAPSIPTPSAKPRYVATTANREPPDPVTQLPQAIKRPGGPLAWAEREAHYIINKSPDLQTAEDWVEKIYTPERLASGELSAADRDQILGEVRRRYGVNEGIPSLSQAGSHMALTFLNQWDGDVNSAVWAVRNAVEQKVIESARKQAGLGDMPNEVVQDYMEEHPEMDWGAGEPIVKIWKAALRSLLALKYKNQGKTLPGRTKALPPPPKPPNATLPPPKPQDQGRPKPPVHQPPKPLHVEKPKPPSWGVKPAPKLTPPPVKPIPPPEPEESREDWETDPDAWKGSEVVPKIDAGDNPVETVEIPTAGEDLREPWEEDPDDWKREEEDTGPPPLLTQEEEVENWTTFYLRNHGGDVPGALRQLQQDIEALGERDQEKLVVLRNVAFRLEGILNALNRDKPKKPTEDESPVKDSELIYFEVGDGVYNSFAKKPNGDLEQVGDKLTPADVAKLLLEEAPSQASLMADRLLDEARKDEDLEQIKLWEAVVREINGNDQEPGLSSGPSGPGSPSAPVPLAPKAQEIIDQAREWINGGGAPRSVDNPAAKLIRNLPQEDLRKLLANLGMRWEDRGSGQILDKIADMVEEEDVEIGEETPEPTIEKDAVYDELVARYGKDKVNETMDEIRKAFGPEKDEGDPNWWRQVSEALQFRRTPKSEAQVPDLDDEFIHDYLEDYSGDYRQAVKDAERNYRSWENSTDEHGQKQRELWGRVLKEVRQKREEEKAAAPKPNVRIQLDPDLPLPDRIATYQKEFAGKVAEEVAGFDKELNDSIEAAKKEWKETGRKMWEMREQYGFHVNDLWVDHNGKQIYPAHIKGKEAKAEFLRQVKEYHDLFQRNQKAQDVAGSQGKNNPVNQKVRDRIIQDFADLPKAKVEFTHGPKTGESLKRNVNKAESFVHSLAVHTGADWKRDGAEVKPIPQDEDQRASCSWDARSLNLSQYDNEIVAVHEMGHWVEFSAPGALEACLEFLAHRVGREKPEKLKDKFPGSAYRDGENGRKDNFDKAFDANRAWYCGKDYGGTATEILSMGLEALYNNPVRFAKDDPEYFAFILGILDGSLRKY